MPIHLQPLGRQHASDLVRILQTDAELQAVLGSHGHIDASSFLRTCEEWMERQDGQTYCLLLGDMPIGTISISRKGLEQGCARVGYWLSSAKWNQGYATKAFDLIIDEAKANGDSKLVATIPKTAAASVRIWRKNGATFKENPGDYSATLSLA